MTNEERQQAIEWLKRRPVMMAGAKRMYNLAIEALEGKDIDVHTKSALDNIHNVVKEDAYKRGYEQSKKDAAPKWIPVSERPPKEEGDYIVTDEGGRNGRKANRQIYSA